MKFGHNLPRNQVPEWSAEYINYKGLKKLIKAAAAQQKQGGAPDLAGWSSLQSAPASKAAGDIDPLQSTIIPSIATSKMSTASTIARSVTPAVG